MLFEQNPSNSAFSFSNGMVCVRPAVRPLRRKNREGELPRAA